MRRGDRGSITDRPDEPNGPDEPTEDGPPEDADDHGSDLGDIFPPKPEPEPFDLDDLPLFERPDVDSGEGPVEDAPSRLTYSFRSGDGPRRFSWPWILGGAGIVGVVLGFVVLNGGGGEPSDSTSAPAAGSATPTTQTTTTTTSTTTTTTVATTTVPAPPHLDSVPLPRNLSYVATKTRDLILPTSQPEPVGTAYPGILSIDLDCATEPCNHSSVYDLERTFLDRAEFGTRSPSTWSRDGATWTIEMVAHTIQSQTSEFICVIRLTQTWELTVTAAEQMAETWVASVLTATLVQDAQIEQSVSTGGEEICGSWQAADEWAIDAFLVSG